MSTADNGWRRGVARTLFSFLVLCWPLSAFAERNLLQPNLSFSFLVALCVCFFCVCTLITIFNRVVLPKHIRCKAISAELFCVSVSFIFTLLCFSIVKLPPEFSRASLVVLVLLFLLFYVVNRWLLQKKNTEKLFVFFFATVVSITFGQIIYKIPALTKVSLPSGETPAFIGQKFTDQQRSVYYIVLDSQISFDQIKKLRSYFSVDEFEEEFKQLQSQFDQTLIEVPDSRSSYNMTYLAIRSIFDLYYFIDESSERYENRVNMYPAMMKESTNLGKVLGDHGYEMFWLGNEWGPCGDSEFKCLRETISRSSYTKDVVGKFLPAIESGRIMFGKVWERIIGQAVDSEDTGENYSSTIKVLINKIQTIKNSNPKFVFVHEMAPHYPYKYGSNCEVVDREEVDPWDPKNVRRYLTNSICALKSTLQTLAVIRQHDPEAVIVVQADHGADFTEGDSLWEKDIKETGFSMATPGIKNRMGILNYMSLPESCPLEIDTLQTNVQTAQAAVACALGYTPKLTSGESYWGVYRTNPSSFGFVKNITPLKDLSFPQEK